MILISLLFVWLSCESFEAVHLPPEIHKCSKSDPEFSTCMAKSMTEALTIFKDGSKEFGFPSLQPLQIKKMEIEASPGKSVNLNQVYENVKMHGLVDSNVVKFSLTENGDSCLWELEVHTPMSRMEADYKMSGQIMIFPINGHGRCNVTLYDIVNKHRADCENYMKKGKTYTRLKNYSMDMSADKVQFDFENMFPGNEQISNEISKTINENSMVIFQEVKQGFEQVLSKLHESSANNVFSRVPLNELYLP